MIVAMGYYPGDQELAKKLAAWIRELGPNKGHTMLLARDVRCANDGSIKANLEAVFDKVEIINVPEKIDGWQHAPNIVIRTLAVHVEHTQPQPWLFIEPDVVPLREGWVDALATEYDEHKKPFLGDFVKVKDVIPHCSGIAVYPGKVTDHAPNIKFAAQSEIPWDVYAADQIVPKMAQSRHIAHRWLHPAFNNQSEVDNILGQLGPDCVLFHSDHSGTLINFLRERKYPKPEGLVEPLAAIQGDSAGIVERSSPVCDIFIKTCTKDYPWLEWCAKSIVIFAHGFRDVITIDDKDDKGNDGYLYQQVTKMYADLHSDADYILHIDSDTIFTRPVTPETYFKDGKPIIMITPIELAHPDEQQAWRRVMHKFMGKPSEYEFMRRFPIVYPSWAYKRLREFCERQHGMSLDKYIMAQPYREFSEFNVMGFYLWEYHRDKFEWFDTSKHPESEWPTLTVDQQHSWGGISDALKEKWEKILNAVPVLADNPNYPSIRQTESEAGPEVSVSGEVRESNAKATTKNANDSRGGVQTTLSVGHGEEKQPVPILRGSPLGESPKPDRHLTLKEKRQQQAAKMRAAKELKRRFNLGVAETLKEWPVLSESEIAELEKDHAKHLEYHLKEVAKYFNSPLAKGRIFKRLKAFPVIK